MPITAFHGSAVNGIERFDSFSHFGSKKAAYAAAARSCATLEVTQGWLYRVSLSVERAELARLDDFGTASLQALAVALQEHFFPLKLLLESQYSDARAIILVRDYLRRSHRHGFAYRNLAEDTGSETFMLPDSRHVRILSCRKLDAPELLQGLGFLSTPASRLIKPSRPKGALLIKRTRAIRRGFRGTGSRR